MMTNPQNSPTMNPVVTCAKVCCRRIILLLPTMPAMIRTRQSHQMGLKAKMTEKASRAPVKPPMAAVWVEIFHQTLMSAQRTCHEMWNVKEGHDVIAEEIAKDGNDIGYHPSFLGS